MGSIDLRREVTVTLLGAAVIAVCVLLLMLLPSPTAHACDIGSYYDPTHQICQSTPPAYTPPGYGWPPVNGGANYGPSDSGTSWPHNDGR